MNKKYAYIFIKRNMGSGYEEAYPPCSFFKKWIFRKYLLKKAEDCFQEMLSINMKNKSVTELEDEFRKGLRGKSDFWHGFLFEMIERKPDEKCIDPLAERRCPTFKMTIIMEGKPQIFPIERFDNFIQKCFDKANEIMQPGVNDELKIEIPPEFFELSED